MLVSQYEMGGGETEVQIQEVSGSQSRKGKLTFEWSSLTPALLRAFLFFDYDDNTHGSNVGRGEVEEMTTEELVRRVEEYDRHVDLSNGGKRSWAHDLLETLRDGDNGDAFGLTLADHQRLSSLATAFQRSSPAPKQTRRQSPPRDQSKQPEKANDKGTRQKRGRKRDDSRSRDQRSPPGRMQTGTDHDEFVKQLRELQSETAALKAAKTAAEKAYEQSEEEGKRPRKTRRGRRKASRSPTGKRSGSRGRDRHRGGRSRSSSSESSSSSSSSASRSSGSRSGDSRSSSRSSSSSSSSSASGSDSSSSRSRGRNRARRAHAKGHRSKTSRKSSKHSKRKSKSSKRKSKKLSKAEASRKIRTSRDFMFKRLWAKVHSSSLSEANDLAGFFASVTSQLRMEAKAGDKKTKNKLEELTDWLESVREETMGSFKRQVKPISASREMVSLAEEQLCLHLRGEVEQSNFLRDIDWRKITMRGIVKVVSPLVKEESKRLVLSRSQPLGRGLGLEGAFAGDRGGDRGGNRPFVPRGGGKGPYAHMAWARDGSRPISCHKCGQLGHYASACPSLAGGAEKQLDGSKKAGGANAGVPT